MVQNGNLMDRILTFDGQFIDLGGQNIDLGGQNIDLGWQMILITNKNVSLYEHILFFMFDLSPPPLV